MRKQDMNKFEAMLQKMFEKQTQTLMTCIANNINAIQNQKQSQIQPNIEAVTVEDAYSSPLPNENKHVMRKTALPDNTTSCKRKLSKDNIINVDSDTISADIVRPPAKKHETNKDFFENPCWDLTTNNSYTKLGDMKEEVTAAYMFSKSLNPEEVFVQMGFDGVIATRGDLACLESGKPITNKIMNFAAQFFQKETYRLRSACGYLYITHDFVVDILNGTVPDINRIHPIVKIQMAYRPSTPSNCDKLHFPLYHDKNWYNVLIDLVHKEIVLFDHIHKRVVSERMPDIGTVVTFLLSGLHKSKNSNVEKPMSIQDFPIKFNTVANGPFSKEDSGVVAMMLMRARNSKCQIHTSDVREMRMTLMMQFLYNLGNWNHDKVFADARKWYKDQWMEEKD